MLAVVIFDLNLTMINVALPTLAGDLGVSASELQWISGAYSLTVAAALLPAGLIGDRFGAKRPLITALLVLGTTALVCTQATSPTHLIIGQLVLGTAAGFIPALSLALVKTTFPEHELSRALGVWSIGLTLGIPLGPVIGGYLTAQFGWPALYLLTVPLVVLAAAILARLLPTRGGSSAVHMDYRGSAPSIAGIVALVYGLTEAGQSGWGAPRVLIALGAWVVLLAGFVVWVRRADKPIIDPTLFRSTPFRLGVALSTLVTFTLMGRCSPSRSTLRSSTMPTPWPPVCA